MKHNLKNAMLKFAWLFIAAMVAVTACKKDDDPLPKIDAEDGVYVVGAGTSLTDFDPKGLMKATTNEAQQNAPRAGLFELYIAVKAGAEGFNIVEVTGGASKTYGPGADFGEVDPADKDNEEPNEWFARGSVQETASKFTVPEDGLYHVVYDKTLNVVIVARVKWGVIGGATPLGWGSSTPLPSSAFSLTEMNFTETNVILLTGEYKFRYSNGWKLILDSDVVRVNANYGGTTAVLVPGGDNISNAEPGYYTITVSWTLAAGTSASVTKTGDYTPPAYPDAMYLVGDATAYGWATPGDVDDAIMHKMADAAVNEGKFWKILHLEADQGFKVSASNWADPNLGFGGIDEFDADGVTVSDDGGNMKVAASGMYIVVLNLRDDMVKLSIKPAEVYGIGDAFGTWDAGVAANKFTVDDVAKTITSPALPASANVRMYAAHPWIPAWWNAEFVLVGTDITYRNDSNDDPPAFPGTAGQVITLNFDDNTGSIAK